MAQQQQQQQQQQQHQASQLDVSILLESIRKSFEKITLSIDKSNVEHYPIAVAQKDLSEANALVKKLKDVLKERNLSGYPAGPVEATNVATRQKQIFDNLKQTLQQSQNSANLITKAFNDIAVKK